MNTEFSRKTLSTHWNVASGNIFNWERAETVAIVHKKTLAAADSQPSQTEVAAALRRWDAEVKTDAVARPLNDTVLRILMVEDSRDDCDLICHRLKKCGFKPRVEQVYCEKTMRAALDREPWDVVFTDHGLPGF